MLALGVAVAGGCASSLAYVDASEAEPRPDPRLYRMVDLPPPPPRPEIVPPSPRPDASWIDGEWLARRGRWSWRLGRWVVPPRGAKFYAWRHILCPNATRIHRAGLWLGGDGRPVAPPPPLRYAKAREGKVVDEDDSLVQVGVNRKNRKPRRRMRRKEQHGTQHRSEVDACLRSLSRAR